MSEELSFPLLYQFMLRIEIVILAISVTLLTIIAVVEGREWLRKRRFPNSDKLVRQKI